MSCNRGSYKSGSTIPIVFISIVITILFVLWASVVQEKKITEIKNENKKMWEVMDILYLHINVIDKELSKHKTEENHNDAVRR